MDACPWSFCSTLNSLFQCYTQLFDFYKATGLAGLCSYVTEFAITFDHKVIHQHALAKT